MLFQCIQKNISPNDVISSDTWSDMPKIADRNSYVFSRNLTFNQMSVYNKKNLSDIIKIDNELWATEK